MEPEVRDCLEIVEHIKSCPRCREWLVSVIAKAANLEFLDDKEKKES